MSFRMTETSCMTKQLYRLYDFKNFTTHIRSKEEGGFLVENTP